MRWMQAAWWKRIDEASPGQHYRAAGRDGFGQSSAVIWEVKKLTLLSDGLDYAHLVRVRDRTEHKVVSLQALLDRSMFKPESL